MIKHLVLAISMMSVVGFAAPAMAYPFYNHDNDYRGERGDHDHYRHNHEWRHDCYWVHHHDWNEKVCR